MSLFARRRRAPDASDNTSARLQKGVAMGAHHAPSRMGLDETTAVPTRTRGGGADTRIVADDHFVERDGCRFAGFHLIIDLWQARRLDDLPHIKRTLRQAAEVAGATVLRLDAHRFESSDGISAVAILAESHISIHTWPELSYAAIDIFMCGDTRPHDAIPLLEAAFEATRVEVIEHRRGMLE